MAHHHCLPSLLFLTCIIFSVSFQIIVSNNWRGTRTRKVNEITKKELRSNILALQAEIESDAGGIQGKENEMRENVYREYPFDNISLPILPDCNNYYSGTFGDYFWHQNADQVLVYIPITESITKNDVNVKFGATKVSVIIDDLDAITFECIERIIPDGSFWCIEKDRTGQRYVQLDLEKRFRMINWKALFQAASEEQVDEAVRRSEMLTKLMKANKATNVGARMIDDFESRVKSTVENGQITDGKKDINGKVEEDGDWPPSKDELDSMINRLLAANQGMSKITGAPAETLEEMDAETIRRITAEVNEDPTIF